MIYLPICLTESGFKYKMFKAKSRMKTMRWNHILYVMWKHESMKEVTTLVDLRVDMWRVCKAGKINKEKKGTWRKCVIWKWQSISKWWKILNARNDWKKATGNEKKAHKQNVRLLETRRKRLGLKTSKLWIQE